MLNPALDLCLGAIVTQILMEIDGMPHQGYSSRSLFEWDGAMPALFALQRWRM